MKQKLKSKFVETTVNPQTQIVSLETNQLLPQITDSKQRNFMKDNRNSEQYQTIESQKQCNTTIQITPKYNAESKSNNKYQVKDLKVDID